MRPFEWLPRALHSKSFMLPQMYPHPSLGNYSALGPIQTTFIRSNATFNRNFDVLEVTCVREKEKEKSESRMLSNRSALYIKQEIRVP